MKFIKLFEQFGTSDYLYHTTHIVYFKSILNDNAIKKKCTDANSCTRDFEAVSLTRNEKFFYDNQPFKFKLDRKILSGDYNIEQYIDPVFNGEDLEEEEIVRETIYPLNKYLVSIQFYPKNLEEKWDFEDVYDTLKSYVSKYNIDIELFNGEFNKVDIDQLPNYL